MTSPKSERLTDELRFPKPRNSAGRDVPVAIGVGLGLGALVIIALIVGPLAWYILLAVAGGLAQWEVGERLRESDWQLPRPVMIVGGQAMIWSSWPWGTHGVVTALLSTFLVLLVTRLFLHGTVEGARNWLRDVGVGVFQLLWIPFLMSLAAMLIRMDTPGGVAAPWVIITFMLCVVANDVGGYIAGVFFGKHPMAPVVSPKKSWEGFAGSIILGVAVGVASVIFLLDGPWWFGVALGVTLCVAATMGDLVESQFKRDLGIKDMSTLLPGHGGLMDRLDGMLPAAGMTWALISLLGL